MSGVMSDVNVAVSNGSDSQLCACMEISHFFSPQDNGEKEKKEKKMEKNVINKFRRHQKLDALKRAKSEEGAQTFRQGQEGVPEQQRQRIHILVPFRH